MIAGVYGAQYGVRVGQRLRGEQLRALLRARSRRRHPPWRRARHPAEGHLLVVSAGAVSDALLLLIPIVALVSPSPPPACQRQFWSAGHHFTEKLEIGISTERLPSLRFRGGRPDDLRRHRWLRRQLLAQGKYKYHRRWKGRRTMRRAKEGAGLRYLGQYPVDDLRAGGGLLTIEYPRHRDDRAATRHRNMGHRGQSTHMGWCRSASSATAARLGRVPQRLRTIRETSGVYQRDPGGVQFMSVRACSRLRCGCRPTSRTASMSYAPISSATASSSPQGSPLRVVKTGLEQAITRARTISR